LPENAGHIAVAHEPCRARATEAYARHSREAVEEQWILGNLPLVRHIVQKVMRHLSQTVDLDDLISAGTLGLVKAARAFDPSRDAEFSTYAYIRIRGAVIDELRGRSFVPSNVHKQIRLIEEAYRKFYSVQGRPPSDEQLASKLGLSLAQMYRALQEARRRHFLSIHGLSEEQSPLEAYVPATGEPGPEEQLQRKEMRQRLVQAIRELPEKDRTIVLLYYERDLNMREIAEVLDITESRVSQIHAGALFKLSMKLKGVT